MSLSDNQMFLLMLEEFRRFECEECDGTGKVKFCPSYPDKCKGCEEEPCKKCGTDTTYGRLQPLGKTSLTGMYIGY